MDRRTFLAGIGAGVVPEYAQAQPEPIKLGLDLFSLRSQNWTPLEYLDYCAKWKIAVCSFSETRFLGPGGLQESNLRQIRQHGEILGISIELGMGSITPSSRTFDPKEGTGEEQAIRIVNAARTVGASVIRMVLGDARERAKEMPMEVHIENTVRVLRMVRSRILDAGVKIAMENHGGDMQARELKMLIEEAGTDIVGACLDSGNPVWVVEDPHLTLEVLAPYTLTSHVRDTAVWRVPEGAAARWVRMGEGTVDVAGWVQRFRQLCPGKALSLEIIYSARPRIFNFYDSKFWEAYPRMPAWEFARFLALVERGKPVMARPATPGLTPQAVEREHLEASIRFAQALLNN